MDNLEKGMTLTVTKGDKTFTFKRPNSGKMLAADVLAAQLRGGMPINSLTYGISYSEMIATLGTYIAVPEHFDFGTLYDDELSEIYDEVANWLNTFRKRVESK